MLIHFPPNLIDQLHKTQSNSNLSFYWWESWGPNGKILAWVEPGSTSNWRLFPCTLYAISPFPDEFNMWFLCTESSNKWFKLLSTTVWPIFRESLWRGRDKNYCPGLVNAQGTEQSVTAQGWLRWSVYLFMFTFFCTNSLSKCLLMRSCPECRSYISLIWS